VPADSVSIRIYSGIARFPCDSMAFLLLRDYWNAPMSSSVIGALQMIVRYGMIMMTSDALTTVNEYEEREYPRLTDH